MTDRQPRNVVASIRQRLMNLARERSEDFQFVLTRYGIERFLYRLTQTVYGSQLVLKGAALFQLWTGESHRATRISICWDMEPHCQSDCAKFFSMSVRSKRPMTA